MFSAIESPIHAPLLFLSVTPVNSDMVLTMLICFSFLWPITLIEKKDGEGFMCKIGDKSVSFKTEPKFAFIPFFVHVMCLIINKVLTY